MTVVRTRWLRSSRWIRSESGTWQRAQGIAGIAIAVTIVAGVGTVGRTLFEPASAIRSQAATATSMAVGEHITTGDAWTERLSDPSAWRGGRYASDRKGRRALRDADYPSEEVDRDDDGEDDDEERRPERAGRSANGTFRTVCVRLCDGFFFPISFATTPEYFVRDEAACHSRCSSSARLYVYPADGEPEQMVSVQRQPYSALNTAFLFRTKYDAACTCKPHPWDQEALARHRAYAEAQSKSPDRNPRTVARTVRAQAPQADQDTDSERRYAGSGRPEGAMLLGSDEPPRRETRRAERRQAERRAVEPPRNQRGGTYGQPNDWRSRGLGGF